ncbi:MAG: hypothetical protein LBN95_13385 [Prevotellaceae bacterium]|jgi:hypothetical protein|nr:hypothetical protein [Prevotellaceae bacterium]
MKKLLLFSLFAVCAFSMATADDITSAQNGNWNATATWAGGVVPTSSDNVIINHEVTINANNLACANLTVNAGKKLRFGSNSTTNIFTINGNFVIDGTFEQHNNQGWPVEIYGDFILNSTAVYTASNQNAAGVKITMRGDGGTVIRDSRTAPNTALQRFIHLAINLNSNDAAVTLESDLYFSEVNANSSAVTLTINKGILDFAGHNIHFQKFGSIIVNADGNFAWSHVNCDYTDNNLPSIYYDAPTSGSDVKITGTIYIKNFIVTAGDNFSFPNNATSTVYVFGTLNKTNNNFNMSSGTFIWGPDSWYKSTSNQNQPNGPYAATGATTLTPNTDYEIPDAIQNVLDDCSNTTPCTAVNQNLTVQAENAVVCAGEGTNIQIVNSESGVLYALFVGQNQTGVDVVGTGATINLPTGVISANTTFKVKTSISNDVYCKNKAIGGNVTVTLASGTTPIAQSNVQTLFEGETYSITLTNYSGTIQWQSSETENGTYVDVLNATSAQYSTTELAGSQTGIAYFFRAKVTGGTCGDTYSNPVFVTVYPPYVAPSMPDLIITDITWTPNQNPVNVGSQVIFTAKVKNNGTADIPANASKTFGVRFTINGTYTFCDTFTGALAAGAEVELTANGGQYASAAWAAVLGTHNIVAQVDDDNRITEGNENNNTYTKPISVTDGPTCDLIVEDIIYTWDPHTAECPQRNELITFKAIIKNIGSAPSPAVTGTVEFYLNSEFTPKTGTFSQSIGVGETIEVAADQTWVCPIGNTQTVLAWVNSNGQIAESLTNNNQSSANIATNGACASALNEISISDKIYVENGQIRVSDNSTTIIAVYNILGKEIRNENLPQGVYVVKINSFGKISAGKVLVK